MKKSMSAIVWVAALLTAQCAWAQDKTSDVTDMQALKTAVASDKKALVASTLELSAIEAKKFWPLYETYKRSVDAANRRRTEALEGVVALNKPLSNPFARNVANELMAADESEIRARRALHNGVMKALPAKKAARYLQLESKIRAIQAYDIAATMPLIK
jgi:hypothetical protein